MSRKYEFVVVGSGAGGATVARELARRGREVLLIEQGRREETLGTYPDAVRFYDCNKVTQVPAKSQEGVILWRSLMAGGSTVVSHGNAVRCLQQQLAERGIELEAEYQEAEAEMGVRPAGDRLFSEGSRQLLRSAMALGYRMERMPKMIDARKCTRCGQCVLGCKFSAKWTARTYLREAEEAGAELMFETQVQEVWVENGRAMGIRGWGPGMQTYIRAGTVVLAVGALSTPAILQRSGVDEAGRNLFLNLELHTYGVTKGLNLINEPQMVLLNDEFLAERGFMLSTFINQPKRVRLIEAGISGFTMRTNYLIGLVTKIKDEAGGRVFPDGSVSKRVTERDWIRLGEGAGIARAILEHAGAQHRTVINSRPQGTQPGGTAAIGDVVDTNLQTGIENLFVCDASVLPEASGLPPMLTIVALGKRLGRQLAA